jgi:hypothetical protein
MKLKCFTGAITGTLLVSVLSAPAGAATLGQSQDVEVGQGQWVFLAQESESFSVKGSKKVRYGADTRWVKRRVTGDGACSNAFFGRDPAAGVRKTCEVYSTKKGGGGGLGDLPDDPRLNAGVSGEQVQFTDEPVLPSNDGTGDFRTRCTPSHLSLDNPVSLPGRPGKAPMQVVFGNTGATASSTPESLTNTGNTTCRGGTINRSVYSVPVLVDTDTNQPVVPDESDFYYKSGYLGVTPSSIQLMPPGLRMMAGDDKNTQDPGPYTTRYTWVCHNTGINRGTSIPSCPIGDQLELSIAFPQCWDGVNLDSPDHKSHMAYANGGCPLSHPVPLAEVSYHVLYPVTERQGSWRLSSDTYSGPAGYSAHATWFNGWKEDISDSWSRNCVAAGKDCHSHLLGDGRAVY